MAEIAYSYIRFSSEKQEEGDSLRRQAEAAASYAREKGFVLDDSTTFRDLGLSAYHGRHLAGSLGIFLDGVKAGKIKTPCHLIIENLDRLSRLSVGDGLLLIIKDFLREKVTIHVLNPRQIISNMNDEMSLMYLIWELGRANRESKMKSIRVKEAWNNKRKNASISNPLTKQCPGWLSVIDNKYEFNKYKKTVEKMIELSLDGHGYTYITSYLNKNNYETMSKVKKGKWGTFAVRKTLTSKALIGIHEPESISNKKRLKTGQELKIYPMLMTEEDYYALQAKISKRSKSIKGRTGNINNLFGRLMTDYDDNSTIRICEHEKRKDRQMKYVPASVIHGTRENTSFPVFAMEKPILAFLADGYNISSSDNDSSKKINALEELIKAKELRQRKLLNDLKNNEDLADMIYETLREIKSDINKAKKELEDAKQDISINNKDIQKEIRYLIDIETEDYNSRAKLRQYIISIVKSIKLAFRPFGKHSQHRRVFISIEMNDNTITYFTIEKKSYYGHISSFAYDIDNKAYPFSKYINDNIEKTLYDNEIGKMMEESKKRMKAERRNERARLKRLEAKN